VLETNQLRYFGIEDGDPDEPFLATVDAATGQPVGRRALMGSVERLAAPPVLAAGALWLPQVEPLAGRDAAAPGSGAILAMDQATGQLRSQTVLPAPPVAPPLVAGAAGNHRVLMLESADGLDYVVTGAVGWREDHGEDCDPSALAFLPPGTDPGSSLPRVRMPRTEVNTATGFTPFAACNRASEFRHDQVYGYAADRALRNVSRLRRWSSARLCRRADVGS
jgi:hypothetical protein